MFQSMVIHVSFSHGNVIAAFPWRMRHVWRFSTPWKEERRKHPWCGIAAIKTSRTAIAEMAAPYPPTTRYPALLPAPQRSSGEMP